MQLCGIEFNRLNNLQQHMKNKHNFLGTNNTMMQLSPGPVTFQHPFSMMMIGPSGSGETECTNTLLPSSLIQPHPERILWCLDNDNICMRTYRREFCGKKFVHSIPNYLNSPQFINLGQQNLIIFDGLMTKAKRDQRIADIFEQNLH